jgi:hypothetical protein
MANKIWRITLEDRVHTIELKHGYFTGKRLIRIDGKQIKLPPHERRKRYDTGSTHSFAISNHQGIIVIRPTLLKFEYELIVDGISIDTGLPVTIKDQLHLTPEAVKTRRIAVVATCTLLGFLAMWLNWLAAHSYGFYHPLLAMLGPAALVIAGYYILVPEDPWEIPKPFPLRLVLVIILAMLLGIINWLATEQGLY